LRGRGRGPRNKRLRHHQCDRTDWLKGQLSARQRKSRTLPGRFPRGREPRSIFSLLCPSQSRTFTSVPSSRMHKRQLISPCAVSTQPNAPCPMALQMTAASLAECGFSNLRCAASGKLHASELTIQLGGMIYLWGEARAPPLSPALPLPLPPPLHPPLRPPLPLPLPLLLLPCLPPQRRNTATTTTPPPPQHRHYQNTTTTRTPQ
jgi:hypothetical protein